MLKTPDVDHDVVDQAAADILAVRSFAFEMNSAAGAILDSTGCIIDVNEAWTLAASLNDGSVETTGCGVNYLDVCDVAAAAGDRDGQRVAEGLRRLLSRKHRYFDLEYPCASPEQDRWMLLRATSAPVEHAGIVLFHIDITARRLLEKRLELLAGHDELTALPGRHTAEVFLESRLAPEFRAAGPIGTIQFEIDDATSVEDLYGQCFGDELIVQVVARAQRSVRAGDLLCSVGPNKFLLLCPGIPPEGAAIVAGRLQTVLSEPFQVGSVRLEVGASVGVAFTSSESTVESVLGAADDSMVAERNRRTASGETSSIEPPEVRDATAAAGRRTVRDVNISQVASA